MSANIKHSCDTCKHQLLSRNVEPCSSCLIRTKWESKIEITKDCDNCKFNLLDNDDISYNCLGCIDHHHFKTKKIDSDTNSSVSPLSRKDINDAVLKSLNFLTDKVNVVEEELKELKYSLGVK